jgi:hypothetical protein
MEVPCRRLRIAGYTRDIAPEILLAIALTEYTIGKIGPNSGTIPSVYGLK